MELLLALLLQLDSFLEYCSSKLVAPHTHSKDTLNVPDVKLIPREF